MKMNKENWEEPRNPIRHYHTYLCIMRVKERKRKSRKNMWRNNDWKNPQISWNTCIYKANELNNL